MKGSCENLLKQAALNERLGRHRQAAAQFVKAAAHTAYGPLAQARAYRGAGINFRRAGKYDASMEEFANALGHADTAITLGEHGAETEFDNIVRDFGMLIFDLKDFDGALEMFEASLSGHIRRAEVLEAAASLSFCGRAHDALGNEAMAKRCFESAHKDLLDRHDMWCLNNAVWYMKKLDRLPRMSLGLTALHIAVKLGRVDRLGEVLLLLLAGDHAYERAKQLVRR